MTDPSVDATHPARPDPDELLALARDLAAQAGSLVERLRHEVDLAGETKSSATDVVTAADRAAEQLIVDGIIAQRPEDGLLGEEGEDRIGSSGVRWLIDPIDGTTNYVYNVPAYSISIAAEYDGDLLVAVVFEPKSRQCYHAVAGRGAFVDDRPLAVTKTVDLATSLVGTGFGYRPERRLAQAEVLLTILPRVRDIRRFGSAALDLCFVAEGRLDAYYEKGLNPWDLAAGTLIAREAGALVEDLRGGPPSSDFTLAANPELFSQLGELLRSAEADRHD